MAAIHKESYTSIKVKRMQEKARQTCSVFVFMVLICCLEKWIERERERAKKKCFLVGINNENGIGSREKRDNFEKKKPEGNKQTSKISVYSFIHSNKCIWMYVYNTERTDECKCCFTNGMIFFTLVNGFLPLSPPIRLSFIKCKWIALHNLVVLAFF